MEKIEKKASPVWLIIFLCSIIIGIVFIVTKVKHQMTVDLLNQEIQKLNQEIEQAEKEKEALEKKPFTPSASSSADLKQSSPSEAVATASAALEPKTATASRER